MKFESNRGRGLASSGPSRRRFGVVSVGCGARATYKKWRRRLQSVIFTSILHKQIRIVGNLAGQLYAGVGAAAPLRVVRTTRERNEFQSGMGIYKCIGDL
jgi:hypothetical protein